MKLFANIYILTLALIVIVILFFYNIIVGNKGSYMNHTNLLWTEVVKEFQIPFVSITKQKRKESSGELECKRAAEKITGKRFDKKRPDFLKNNITDSNLEIDCYCEELKLGIEYNGIQHYKYTPYFHASKDAFYNTKYRDEMKQRLCKNNGIKLIVVPYTVKVNEIEDYLKSRI